MNIAFIIAAPRSGTTFLGELLSRHPEVCGWHEPFFIWEHYIEDQQDDYLDASDATDKIQTYVRREFERCLRKSGKAMLIEKTPNNAFKIKFMQKIFPEARWIHLYRDGRNVIPSIKLRYNYRKTLVENKSIISFVNDVTYTLKRQPFWRYRYLAVRHELTRLNHIRPYLYGIKDWKNTIGWGPRYPGWQNDKLKLSELEIMAKQWVKCEEYIQKDAAGLPQDMVFKLQYETLQNEPKKTLIQLAEFLGISKQPLNDLAGYVNQANTKKSQSNLSQTEIDKISTIIDNMLTTLGYI